MSVGYLMRPNSHSSLFSLLPKCANGQINNFCKDPNHRHLHLGEQKPVGCIPRDTVTIHGGFELGILTSYVMRTEWQICARVSQTGRLHTQDVSPMDIGADMPPVSWFDAIFRDLDGPICS